MENHVIIHLEKQVKRKSNERVTGVLPGRNPHVALINDNNSTIQIELKLKLLIMNHLINNHQIQSGFIVILIVTTAAMTAASQQILFEFIMKMVEIQIQVMQNLSLWTVIPSAFIMIQLIVIVVLVILLIKIVMFYESIM
ncbi:MAG: hypothetical protein ACPG2Y_01845, partial [Acholeplasmataceae bacterium]